MRRPSSVAVRKSVAATIGRAPAGVLQRQCACGQHTLGEGECEKCAQEHMTLQRHSNGMSAATGVPRIVHEVLRSQGQPLDVESRSFFESRFGHDFSHVRVHTDSNAIQSARAVSAKAYTVGRDIVFGTGQYAPETGEGRQLLAHELTHTVQQGTHASSVGSNLKLGSTGTVHEAEAELIASRLGASSSLRDPTGNHGVRETRVSTAIPAGNIQRQLITPLGPGGGFSGLMERDRQKTSLAMSTPFLVCSRPLQKFPEFLGLKHAYIEAPPNRYAVITPLCKPTDGGSNNVVKGAVASKWANSPDPCGKEPKCVPCRPKSGVSDVGACLNSAFGAYNSPNLYKALGPNSNTFAGTLARACCADMTPKPRELGNVPGWNDSPAPPRKGECPKDPNC